MNNEVNLKEQREQAQQKYNSARTDLLIMIGLTLINIILLIAGSDSMMLFSASVPYFVAVFGYGTEIFGICIGIAIAIMVIYLLCWLLSKKNHIWIIVALVLFIIDTLFLCGIYVLIKDVSGILDFVIHIAVLYYLIIGVKAGVQLKKMPEEVIEQEILEAEIIEEEEITEE